jgi:hypothetical protein
MDATMLNVFVTGFNGDQAELRVDASVTLYALKEQLEHKFHIPSQWQQLLVGGSVLPDEQRVASCEEVSPCTIAMMMIVVVETDSARSALRHILLADRGDQRALNISSACLQHADSGVRFGALKVLGRVARRHHAHIREAISSCLEDKDACVRSAARKATDEIAMCID